MSKVLANWLKGVMDKLISPHQAAFIVGRLISNNILMSHEIFHHMRKHHSRSQLMTIKMDLSKTYDRIEWPYLIRIIGKMRFSKEMDKFDFPMYVYGLIPGHA